MRIIKYSERKSPKVSLILLDWSVRESFHLLHYLSRQSVDRDLFEVIIIEYYGSVSEPLGKFEPQVDTWAVLEMPTTCYYHKHLMYNVGITLAKGEVVMIGDSDAMVKETFIETLVKAFQDDPNIVYHIDQFRNMRRDFYPFNYPSFEDVIGEGCINNVNGQTAGVLNTVDPIHSRNYGACMCAKRTDLIAIGGSDEHIDYLGHICGPYDMTFRLTNFGKREIWDMKEFMFHTWHPGQAGTDNYLGPHDGRHMSTTSLEALTSGRTMPLVENAAIRMLREQGPDVPLETLLEKVIAPEYATEFDIGLVDSKYAYERFDNYEVPMGIYRGYRIVSVLGRILAHRLVPPREGELKPLDGETIEIVRTKIDEALGSHVRGGLHRASRQYLAGGVGKLAHRRAAEAARTFGRAFRMSGQLLLGPVLMPLLYATNFANFRNRLRQKLRVLMTQDFEQLDGLTNLAACLSLMHSEGYVPADERVVVLVGGVREQRFLGKLASNGNFPRMEIHRTTTAEQVRHVLDELKNRRWNGSIVVPGGLFTQHHAVFQASPYAGRYSVI